MAEAESSSDGRMRGGRGRGGGSRVEWWEGGWEEATSGEEEDAHL